MEYTKDLNYKVEGETHRITLDKNEMLTLISLVHEGLENLKEKASISGWVESVKYDGGKRFVDDLNRSIMHG